MSPARIASVEVLGLRIPLRLPFTHHQTARRESRPQLVRVRLADGTVGYGEAQPRPYVTGESEVSVRATLGDLAGRVLGRAVPDLASAVALVHGAALGDAREQAPAAFGALEMALLDAAGRREGRSVAEVLGGIRRTELRADGAVAGLMPLPALRFFAGRLKALGKRRVKLKVGRGDDAERLAVLRGVLGPAPEIVLDANGAWTRDEAVRRIRALEPFGLAAVEQPVARQDVDGLAVVSRSVGVPIMADESLCTRVDARRLLEREACALWNLRVGKCGGLLATLELARLAARHGIGCQLGVMVGETGILAAAGRVVAGCAAGLEHVETDDIRILSRDVLCPPLAPVAEGWARVPLGPGLGVDVQAPALGDLAEVRLEAGQEVPNVASA